MEATTIPAKPTARQAYLKAVEAETKASRVKDDVDAFINGDSTDVNSIGAKTMLHTLTTSSRRIEAKIDSTNKYIIGLIITLIGGFGIYFFTNLLPKIVAVVSTIP